MGSAFLDDWCSRTISRHLLLLIAAGLRLWRLARPHSRTSSLRGHVFLFCLQWCQVGLLASLFFDPLTFCIAKTLSELLLANDSFSFKFFGTLPRLWFLRIGLSVEYSDSTFFPIRQFFACIYLSVTTFDRHAACCQVSMFSMRYFQFRLHAGRFAFRHELSSVTFIFAVSGKFSFLQSHLEWLMSTFYQSCHQTVASNLDSVLRWTVMA